MSGAGSPGAAVVDASGLSLAIVATRWHREITDALVARGTAAAIAAEGRGVVLYLRGHEGRGVGLLSKLQAYELQDAGADTVDANTELGLPVDAREYSAGAQMLADLGVRSVRLLTNNPAKVTGLAGCGVDITARVPLASAVTPFNLRYLVTKRDRLGHEIHDLNDPERAGVPAPAPLSGHPSVVAAPQVYGSSGAFGSESA